MSQQNVRSSHFVLGSTNQSSQFVSTMKMNYTLKPEQQIFAKKINTQNARVSHFELGAQKNQYQTSSNTQYKPHMQIQSAKLNDEKKQDLRNSHFQLGHQEGAKVSVNKATFTEKPVTQQKVIIRPTTDFQLR